jgi:hypothetical protein
MDKPFKQAELLAEVASVVSLEPLPLGDPRYVDVSVGRQSSDLKLLRTHLGNAAAMNSGHVKIALTGHRGCGKSTELLRVEHDLAPLLFPVHLYVDQNLERDLDYTDLLLWLVEELARRFADADMPLNTRLIDDVAKWFAHCVKEDVSQMTAEIEATTQAEVKAKASLPWLGLGLLARLKSMIKGSTERRQTFRSELQKYATDLVAKVNLVLDNAATQLDKQRQKKQLLIIQDNLDRLPADVSRKLFFDNGDMLKQLRAHIIFTVPVAIVLAPYHTGSVFERCLHMPTLKPKTSDGKSNQEGLDVLVKLVESRVATDRIFDSGVLLYLAQKCGGSVRDLLRLVGYAADEAQVDEKTRIDPASAESAARRLRLEFERVLIPGHVYYPLLARIHQSKRDSLVADPSPKPEDVKSAREFFSQLLFSGAVLEYNGDEHWYDVHPAVQETKAFQDAYSTLRKAGDKGTKSRRRA